MMRYRDILNLHLMGIFPVRERLKMDMERNSLNYHVKKAISCMSGKHGHFSVVLNA